MAIPQFQYSNWGANVGNALAQGMYQRKQNQNQNALKAAIGPATQGDPNALAEVMRLSPDLGYRIQQDAQQRNQQMTAEKKTKFVQDLTGAVAAYYQQPEEARPQVYAGFVSELQRRYPEMAKELSGDHDPAGVQQLAMSLAAQNKDYADLLARSGAIPANQGKESSRFIRGGGNMPIFDTHTQQYVMPPEGVGVQNKTPSYGGLSAAWDENDNPVFIQPNKQGGARPIRGYRPFSADPEAQRAVSRAKDGGKLDAKREAAQPKVKASLVAAEAKTKNVIRVIDEALPMVSDWTAAGGANLALIPWTGARDLSKKLDTIKANIGFSELNEMRANSPTGGALGQVTERELAFLQSVIANIDQDQSPAQLRQALNDVRNAYIGSMGRLREAYQEEYGTLEGAPAALQGGEAIPAPEGIDPEDWKYMTPEEQSAWQN